MIYSGMHCEFYASLKRSGKMADGASVVQRTKVEISSVFKECLAEHPVKNVKNLTDLQLDAITAVVNKRDTFVTLPTGYGKSLIFQMLPCIVDKLEKRDEDSASIVIIVCPLVSLIEAHLDELRDMGIAATQLTDHKFSSTGSLARLDKLSNLANSNLDYVNTSL
jgi:superfamily II DNA helicase RecQ